MEEKVTGVVGKHRMNRRNKADLYRQLYLLPRYVEEEDGTKRKLEPGEFNPDSHLYPLLTPVKELSDFGIGIGMYFSTTMWFGILMLVCALIQTPIAHHFGTTAYDKYNYQDDNFKSFGSAACLDMNRVCLNEDCTKYAGEGHFPSQDTPRYASDYDHFSLTRPDGSTEGLKWYPRVGAATQYVADDDRAGDYDDDRVVTAGSLGTQIDTVTLAVDSDSARVDLWVGKRNCKIQRWFGAVDLAMMIVVCVSLLVLGYWQNLEAEALDLAEQTAQDYSVMVEDPNPDEVDPDHWKEFFESRFGPVFMVTVCLNNGPLLKLYKQKRDIEMKMKLEASEEARYAKAKRRASEVEPTFLEQMIQHQSAKSYFKQFMEFTGIDPTLEYYTLELLKVNMAISRLKGTRHSAAKVFVMFNDEASQRACLEAMCVGVLPAMFDAKSYIDDKFLYKGNLLAIREAPEPSSVLYENLHTTMKDHVVQQIVSWSIMGVALVCTFFSVQACFQEGAPVLGAILISFWNSVLPSASRYLVVSYETHHTTEAIENSFLAKTVAARWFTSSIILYMVGISHPTQILSPYFIGSIQAVLLADALTTPVLRLLDLSGNFKRWVLAPLAGTDDRAKHLNVGTDWLLAERFTDLAKTVLMSLFFSAIFPTGYWYSALACFLCFWVDKFCLLRIFRQKPPAGDRLVRVTRTFTGLVVLIHAIITCHLYYSWPFDNLCRVADTPLSSAGEAIAAQLGVVDTVVYEYCSAISSDLLPPALRAEGWFQDQVDGGNDQLRLVQFFNVVAIVFVVYVAVVYFGTGATASVYALFFYRYSGVGEAKDIPYDTVETGEGFVPQIHLLGEAKSVLAVTAPHAPGEVGSSPGGCEFSSYLIAWTAAKERTGEEKEEELGEDLTPEEKDAIYRAANVYFDDQLEGLDPDLKANFTLSRAKQYIKNHQTQVAGAFRKSLKGRAQRSLRLKEKGSAKGSLAQRSMRRLSKGASSLAEKAQAAVAQTQSPKEAHGNAELEEMVRRSTLAEEDMTANALAAAPAAEEAEAAAAGSGDEDGDGDGRPKTEYPVTNTRV